MKSIALFALLAATPALADCPIGADLSGGIRVVESDGYSIDEVVHYIPDLRLSLLYSFDDSESSLETFIPVQIEAVR